MEAFNLEARPRALPPGFLEALIQRFGPRCSTAQSVREQHGRGESPYAPLPPDAVVFAETVDDVTWVARHCHAHGVALIAHGAGSSLEGHLLAVEGGVSLDLTGLNKVTAVHAEDLCATVEAGVTREQLNDELRHTGLFFPIDPGANATLGGMAATRASGTNAVRYGTMRENVLALKVVLADGRVIRTAGRARKSSAGYDLTHLFIGSEGTLGIIVEVTLRLYPRPQALSVAVCNFPDLEAAVDSVVEIIQTSIPVARVEFMDVQAVRATNRYSHLELRETPLLLFEFHGSPAGVREQVEAVQRIVAEHGALDFQWAEQAQERERLWAARHKAYFAALQLRPGCRATSTDVCVPISRLAECVRETARDLDGASFPYTMLGHVGDGNFHVVMMLDAAGGKEWIEAEALNRRMVERAIAMDGTCTGEHGVGVHKQAFMRAEHGEAVLEVMQALKAALDPRNILNPGKVLPPQRGPM
ncbi:MAG: FAD-binding protein [Nevskiaceae bacterium]|nr:MAG: FAD-binding protein [Nevskiaceae bacterium]TBR72657.1 MAG: FAD-binding protein [Nevskiaceae bacterium]